MAHPILQSAVSSSWIAALAVFVAVACSSKNPGDGEGFLGGEAGVVSTCSASVDCPESGAPPTYSDDVAPILAAHCTGCHGPGGENQDVPLTSSAALTKKSGTSYVAQTAITDVIDCKMPPAPLPGLSEQEVKTFVCWWKGVLPSLARR